ncbi:MAG TPA: diguanylate cyclase [Burkholderiales bacterium]|nr:diguanylate cyclase [Burkholderiales bacterium]
MSDEPTLWILMYGVLPLWLLAGFLDWVCHRAAHIETSTGPKESLIHLLMFAEMGLPLLAAIFLQVNAGVLLTMIVAFFLHEATAMWDVRYAVTARDVTPIEQHVHSFLEVLPLTATLFVVSRHWTQFEALFGAGPDPADFSLAWKHTPLPVGYIVIVLTLMLVFEVLPYLEELFRGLRANGGALAPGRTRGKGRP